MKKVLKTATLLFFLGGPSLTGQDINTLIMKEVSASLPFAETMYRDLHQNPELSFQEFRTALKMAEGLKKLGFDVTTGVGGNGVVGVMKNGTGPVIMLRTDLDALPVKEATGLPYASKVTVLDLNGTETPVMHACGHDLHMTVWWGTLNTIVSLKNRWKGTIIAVAQPAEERSGGSEQMINDGLYTRFPLPDYALAYHVASDMPAGTIGYREGPMFAGVTSVDVKIFGVGGHGAMPHKTVDPIVLAARIILDYQTIVSREINPVSPAVVTVGSIHGGVRHNIIPSEVDLQLTVRFFSDEVREQILSAIHRISRGVAISAGLNESLMPRVSVEDDFTPPVDNDPELVSRAVSSMSAILGKQNLIKVDPATVAEDFGKYGRTSENIKIGLFWLGGVNVSKYQESVSKNTVLPVLHSEFFYPDFRPAYTTGATAMSRAIIDLLQPR
ncbi:MAG: amidohydrolase [Bacteroidales bacterium]|nr:amidohydrolase [Bacteroidales bacterium]